MKILSLFDGISCARVALERAGIPVDVYIASEIDKYAIEISKKNYPDQIHFGSVTDVSGLIDTKKPFYATNIDLLIGGSPYQDLSIAKKNRKGLEGDRSGLFWEYVRILKEVKPKYFILENVNSMPKEAKALITETLGVEPIMINASLVSAQNRKRLFWTNIPNVILPEDRGILLKDILEKDVEDKFISSAESIKNNWRITKALKTPEEKSKALTATMWKGAGNDGMTTIRIGSIGKGGQGDRIYSKEGKSVALSANGGGRGAKTGLYEVKGDIRKLTPVECERLQSLPDNYTGGVSNSQRYKCLGNAFNVDVVAHILSFIPKQ
jgi:DNA (cytosine-5)-methyltransferase 3A